MQQVAKRFDDWVDLVIGLVQQPDADFPRAGIAGHLAATFRSTVTWNWLTSDGRFRYEMDRPLPGFTRRAEIDELARSSARNHPLLQWYGHTRETAPMAVNALPRRLVATAPWRRVVETLQPLGLDRQLAIPLRLDRSAVRSFVLARGEDYTDAELALACQIQPLLAMLDRQSEVLACARPAAGNDGELTGRELAVLQLLADGLTAKAIGRRLLVSERTVHAHLRSSYRKLGVSDRVSAVLTVQELGYDRAARGEGCAGGAPLPGPSGRLHDPGWPHVRGLWGAES